MIRSATLGAVDTDLISRVPRQIEFAVAGIFVLFITAAIDYRLLGALHNYIYGFLVFLLGLVAALGVAGAAGAQRWLTVGIPIQPSEAAKLLLVIALAKHLEGRYLKLQKFQTVLLSLAYVGVPAVFIFLQPSLGITLLILFTWFVMVYAAGLRARHLLALIILVIAVSPLVWSKM